MVDHRSDIYSIGCVFYELLTGAPPFIGDNALSTMMKHQGQIPLSLKEASMGTTFPPVLEQIVAKLLEKDPNRRYQNGNALVVDLLPLTQTSNHPNTIPLPKQIPIIPSRQGQTTQFLQSETGRAKLIDKAKLIGILAATAIVFFVAGFATCFYFVLPGMIKGTTFMIPAHPPIEPFLERKGNTTVFHFPAGVENLGKLSFNEMRYFDACMKVKIPANRLIGFRAGDFIIANPRYWEGFAPNDLSLIDLGGKHSADTQTFAKLSRFTGLKALNVGKTTFGRNDFHCIESLPSIVSLTVGYCINLSAGDLLKLKILPNLVSLDVAELKDGPLIARNAYKLPNLRQLMLSGCNLTDDDVMELSKSKSIKVLSLAYNAKITDAGIAHLKDMKQLIWLCVTGTHMTPKSAEILATLPNLKLVESADTRWQQREINKFIVRMKQKNPRVAVEQTELEPSLAPTIMPQFPWQGPWMLSSKLLDAVEAHSELEQMLKL